MTEKENKIMATLKREQVAAMGIHYIYYPLDYMLDAQRDAGYKAIELWAASPHYLLDWKGYQSPQEIRKKVEDRGMKIGSFCPECATYHYTLCGDSRPQYSDRSMEYFKQAIKCASELGARVMLINCIGGTFDEEYERVYERAVKNLKTLGKVAADNDVIIAVETVRPEESQVIITLPELQKLMKDVAHPNIKPAIDTVAVGVANETLEEWFKALGNEITHMHFVDGRPYGHLVWGDGLFPLEDYINTVDKYGYKGLLTQEITDDRYFVDPAKADKRNFAMFEPYFSN
jgi:fructoselysine 3-epimerase